MKYRPSKCICFETPARKHAVAFYRDILGFPVTSEGEASTEFDFSPVRLFVDQQDRPQVIFELLVDDLERAREELLQAGCHTVRWEGKGGCCYIRDPFGLTFNLYEES
jgi:catechol 2,3-dioxygenase-like lactoylglutathione lyase family enzyme